MVVVLHQEAEACPPPSFSPVLFLALELYPLPPPPISCCPSLSKGHTVQRKLPVIQHPRDLVGRVTQCQDSTLNTSLRSDRCVHVVPGREDILLAQAFWHGWDNSYCSFLHSQARSCAPNRTVGDGRMVHWANDHHFIVKQPG